MKPCFIGHYTELYSTVAVLCHQGAFVITGCECGTPWRIDKLILGENENPEKREKERERERKEYVWRLDATYQCATLYLDR